MPDVDAHVRRGHPSTSPCDTSRSGNSSSLTRHLPLVIFGALIVFGIIEGAITSWLVRQYQHGEDSYPNGAFRDRLRFAV
jgi:hypothetical protein